MSTKAPTRLRIGELAELTGTTPRTIRYYEEIGLLEGADRAQGQHRWYTQADVERVREIFRLRDLLGLSLEQLSQLVEAETARAEIRREYKRAESAHERQELLERALGHIETQLDLVSGRRRELEKLEGELMQKRRSIKQRLRR
jgi:DNA-binding transcriptional MerR regulator